MNAQPMLADPTKELIEAMTALASLLVRETDLLRKMRVRDASQLKDEKERLTERYTALATALKREPAKLRSLAPARRKAVAQIARQFAEIAAANRRAVKGAIDANEALFQAIAEAAGARDSAAAPYGRGGTLPPAARAGAKARAVTLNTRL